MDSNIQAVQICKEFGWTFEEYLNTPIWFIDLIAEMSRLDNKNLKRQQKKHGRK